LFGVLQRKNFFRWNEHFYKQFFFKRVFPYGNKGFAVTCDSGEKRAFWRFFEEGGANSRIRLYKFTKGHFPL
jgi:hypothetical protein